VPASQLRRLLDEEKGWEEFRMVIPHPFLPPRFSNLAEGRNMLLVLDIDLALHVRWEGARLCEEHPLTPGETNRLLGEVLRNMTKYRRDLKAFQLFSAQNAVEPFESERDLLFTAPEEKSITAPKQEEELDVSEYADTLNKPLYRGGEAPIGEINES